MIGESPSRVERVTMSECRHTHTHIHTQREREREKESEGIHLEQSNGATSVLCNLNSVSTNASSTSRNENRAAGLDIHLVNKALIGYRNMIKCACEREREE